MPELITTGAIAVVVIIILIIGYIAFRRSYRVAAPNEALIITGKAQRKDSAGDVDLESGSRVVVGGRAFVRPLFDRAYSISLSSRQIGLEIEAMSSNNIPLSLEGVAQIKVGESTSDIRKAAQRFLDQQDEIDRYSREVLSGTMRSAVGTLTVESLLGDRASFAERIQGDALESMNNQGLVIDTFQIISINDRDGSYLRDLGRPEAAAAARTAAIAESQAQRESTEARNSDAQRIADSQKALDLRNADIQRETAKQKAEAAAAEQLAQAEQKQRILAEQQKIADGNNDLRERELIAEVRKPADAKKYEAQQLAESERYAREQAAEADLAEARSKAQAVKAQGEAEADAVRAKGVAEAESIDAAAAAYAKYNDAAKLSEVLRALPEIAGKLVEPYGKIDSLSIISADGESKLAENTAVNLEKAIEMISSTTGLDVKGLLGSIVGDPKPQPAPEPASAPAWAAPPAPEPGTAQ